MSTALLAFLALTWCALPTCALSQANHWFRWRDGRLPRIELPPDPSRIKIVPLRSGWALVSGAPRAVADRRGRIVRIINLCTADQVATPVGLTDHSKRAYLRHRAHGFRLAPVCCGSRSLAPSSKKQCGATDPSVPRICHMLRCLRA
jgi:hypothetical protein